MTEAAEAPAGIVAFDVDVKASRDYQTSGLTLHYQLAGPSGMDAVAQLHAELAEQAGALAADHLEQHIERVKADGQRTFGVQQQPPTHDEAVANVQQGLGGEVVGQQQGAPPAQQPQGDGWLTAQKPNGQGSFEFPSTAILEPGTLKTMLCDQIRGFGDDPNCFAIYDNRVGQYALEDGNSGYSIATVKPVKETDLQVRLANKAAYLVDVDRNGLTVKRSKEYEAALGEGYVATPF